MPSYSDTFQEAIQRFDEANAQDPNLVDAPLPEGTTDQASEHESIAKELLYSQRMSHWLEKIYPEASEALALAARAQHICRWKSPRSDYPEGRQGYRQWRKDLGTFHADTAATILREVGYPQDLIDEVHSLLRKEELKTNPDTQRLEDIACLVFLQYHLEEFVQKYQYDDEKMNRIIRKTWKKMSPEGHQAAALLTLTTDLTALVERALTS